VSTTSDTDPPVFDAKMRDILGPLSSHPTALRRRARISFTLAVGLTAWLTWSLAPLLSFHHAKGMISSLFPGGLLERLMRSSSALPGEVRQIADALTTRPPVTWSTGDVWLWFAMAVGAGALVAVGLSDRFAAYWASKPELRGFNKGETWTFPLALGIGLVLVFFALPVAAFVFRVMPPRWEMFADLALLALLWTLMAWAGFGNHGGERRRWPLLAGAGLLWAAPAYSLVTGFLSQGFGSLIFGTLGGVSLPSLVMPSALQWGLLVAGLMSFLGWILWPKSRKADVQAAEKKAEPLDHEAVVAEILASLRTRHQVLKPLAAIAPAETSPISASAEFWPLFMHRMQPTTDQVAFLEKYRAGVKEFAREVANEPFETDWWNGFNMLLAGGRGSGRTTTLIATALYASTATGSVALVIAPRADKVRWLVSRVQDVLKVAGMHTHFTCRQLDKALMHAVLGGKEGAPSVLVATPQDLEDCIFGLGKGIEVPLDDEDKEAKEAKEASNERLRLLVGSLQAVFVENLSDFDPVPRSHLVFQLEKLRLRLGAMGRGMTAVVVVPTMDESAGMALGSRIFGETGFRPDRDLVILRPAPFEKTCLSVELGAADPAGLSDEIAEALLRKGLSTVLLRSGIAEASCTEHKAKIAAAAGGGRLEVLGDLDQRYEGGREFDAVVYQNLTTLDATVAIGIRFAGETVVLFHVRPAASSMLVEPGDSAIPVLAGRESASLVTYHSLSFWSGLRPGENIEREWMKRLVPDRCGFSRSSSSSTALAEVRECEATPGAAVGELMALVRAAPAAFRPVPTVEIPDEDLALAGVHADDGARLTIVRRRAEDVASSTKLRWISAAGQQMARWSVANSPVLLLRAEEQNFAAASARTARDGLEIVARYYQGKGDDLLLPIVDLSWKIPDSSVLLAEGGGADYGARWFRVVDGGSRAPSRIGLQGLFCGLVSERGLATSQTPVPFVFETSCSSIVFDAGGGVDAFDPAVMVGEWSTRPPSRWRHSKRLTTTLSAFLCAEFNGPANFCWPVVFEDDGRAMVWLLEPVTTGSSVSDLLFRLLIDTDFRAKIALVFASPDPQEDARLLPPAPRIGS
jgi:hypothetical protein